MTRRVGILGGTFDPIHQGHLDLGAAAQTALGLDPLFVMPSHVPPHKPTPAASPFHRFAMVALAIAERPGWQASDVELSGAGPTYTATTLDRFHAQGYRPSELFFIVGADAFQDITTWRDYTRVLDGAHFVVVSRAGRRASDLVQQLPTLGDRVVRASADALLSTAPRIVPVDVPTTDASATIVRQRFAGGLPVTGLVPPAVATHIVQHGLYGSISHHAASSAADRLHGKS